MNTQSNQSNNEIKMPNNFKYPNRCRLMWNVKLQKNEWVQYLGGGHSCVPELVDTKITDLSIDILHMINQNTKYIRNKKKLNQQLTDGFRELSVNLDRYNDDEWGYKADWSYIFRRDFNHFNNPTQFFIELIHKAIRRKARGTKEITPKRTRRQARK